jgi:hypothetical protein
MGPVLERVNFSTTRILFGMEDTQAAFLIWEHGR